MMGVSYLVARRCRFFLDVTYAKRLLSLCRAPTLFVGFLRTRSLVRRSYALGRTCVLIHINRDPSPSELKRLWFPLQADLLADTPVPYDTSEAALFFSSLTSGDEWYPAMFDKTFPSSFLSDTKALVLFPPAVTLS